MTVTIIDTPPPINNSGGGGAAVVVEVDGAAYAAAGAEAVYRAALSDGTTISAWRWTVTGPGGFTAAGNAEHLAFAVASPEQPLHTGGPRLEVESGAPGCGAGSLRACPLGYCWRGG